MESLVEAIQRLCDCIYETNQLLTAINKKVEEIEENEYLRINKQSFD